MMRDRNATIDVARGIGIIYVVLGHALVTINQFGEPFRIIASFCVPLFFFLSGIFLRPSGKLKVFALSKFHSLLKPYLVVLSALYVTKFVSWHYFSIGEKPIFTEYLAGLSQATGNALFCNTYGRAWVPLWFLPHLFLSTIITWLVIRLLKSTALILSYAVIALILGTQILGTRELPWSLDLAPITSAFLITGYLCRESIESMQLKLLPAALALLAFFSFHFFSDEFIDLNLRHYGNFFICTAQALLGIYICFVSAKVLEKFSATKTFFIYVGSGTLFILLFHWYTLGHTYERLKSLTGNSFLSLSSGIVVGIGFSLAIFEASKRNRLLSLLFLPLKSSSKEESKRKLLENPQ